MPSENRPEKPSTLDDLTRLSKPELEKLFTNGDTENMPSGFTAGLGIAFPGTFLGRILGKYVRATSWKGKYFEADRKQIRNILSPFSIKAARGELRIDDGILDGKPSIVVDYTNTIAFGLPIRDEIRKIADGLYLGRAFQGSKPTVFFALSNQLNPEKSGYYSGKVAVVTGGASGFGRELTLELARRGAHVIIADINEEGCIEVASEINTRGGSASAVKLDVCSADEFCALIAKTVEGEGQIDFLFNNAGIAVGGEFRDISPELHKKVCDINIYGVLNGIHAVYPKMLEQGSGQIVNTSSISGLIPTPLGVIYAASKHAVTGLSTSLRPEAAALGVKINVICPSAMRTPFFEVAETPKFDHEKLLNSIMFKQKADPEVCAAKTLNAVARNKSIIVVGIPGTWITWFYYRLIPGVIISLAPLLVKHMRKIKIKD
ncbi:MAG: SDR family oxidoreductase [Candidatus Hydrogenedentes bacterium]|nr:SDR family oxidoreductase [Candidatus Hydrogenedentota bacterium]